MRILNTRDSSHAADDIPLNTTSRASNARCGCMRSESIRWRNTSQIKSRITLAAAWKKTVKTDRESGPQESCLCLGNCGVGGRGGQRARACVDYGVHVKVSDVAQRSVSAGSVLAEEDHSWYTSKLRMLQYTYLRFMQVGHSRDCATGTTMSKHCEASSKSDGLKKIC